MNMIINSTGSSFNSFNGPVQKQKKHYSRFVHYTVFMHSHPSFLVHMAADHPLCHRSLIDRLVVTPCLYSYFVDEGICMLSYLQDDDDDVLGRRKSKARKNRDLFCIGEQMGTDYPIK